MELKLIESTLNILADSIEYNKSSNYKNLLSQIDNVLIQFEASNSMYEKVTLDLESLIILAGDKVNFKGCQYVVLSTNVQENFINLFRINDLGENDLWNLG